jgi:hypothetical protein
MTMLPIDVRFIDLQSSEALMSDIEDRAEKLGHACEALTHGRVTVSRELGRGRRTPAIKVALSVNIRGRGMHTVSAEAVSGRQDPGIAVNRAVRQAFETATRHLVTDRKSRPNQLQQVPV